jgi:polar amino acid transport system substrate-binding protein
MRAAVTARHMRRFLPAFALGAAMAFAFGARADGLAVIKQRGVALVGTQADYPPFEFIQDGKIVGYDKDLLDSIIAAWSVKLEQLDLPFAGLLTGLMQKKFDFVCTALLILPERAQKLAITLPIASAPVGFWKRKDDAKVKSIDDLSGLIVGAVVPPSGPTALMTAYNDGLTKSGKGAADIKYFQGSTDLSLALLNAQVDVWATTSLTMNAQLKKYPDKFELVGNFGEPLYYGWATRPDDTSLRDAINIELRRLRDSGEVERLQQKWFGLTMIIPDSGYLPEGAK